MSSLLNFGCYFFFYFSNQIFTTGRSKEFLPLIAFIFNCSPFLKQKRTTAATVDTNTLVSTKVEQI
jgi:hypothetical protein